MSTYVNPVDPPDLGMLPTFRRLLRLWREQWKLGVFALSCSFLYTLISIGIPILIQRAIDNSIARWGLVVALALTWISGLDYARLAPRLLRGAPSAGSASAADSTFSSNPASRQTLQ